MDYTCRIYGVSHLMADILGALVGQTDPNVNISQKLAGDLGEIFVEEGDIFNSHDVVALFEFTNTPNEDSLEITRERLKKDKTLKDRTKLEVDDITDF